MSQKRKPDSQDIRTFFPAKQKPIEPENLQEDVAQLIELDLDLEDELTRGVAEIEVEQQQTDLVQPTDPNDYESINPLQQPLPPIYENDIGLLAGTKISDAIKYLILTEYDVPSENYKFKPVVIAKKKR